jgi:hypothetical protein
MVLERSLAAVREETKMVGACLCEERGHRWGMRVSDGGTGLSSSEELDASTDLAIDVKVFGASHRPPSGQTEL